MPGFWGSVSGSVSEVSLGVIPGLVRKAKTRS